MKAFSSTRKTNARHREHLSVLFSTLSSSAKNRFSSDHFVPESRDAGYYCVRLRAAAIEVVDQRHKVARDHRACSAYTFIKIM
jgi:hypothetical protein